MRPSWNSKHAMTPATSFSFWFLAIVLALLFIGAFVGNVLPAPFGTFVPMGQAIMRTEMIWEYAVDKRPNCVLLVGDSRVAFNINAAELSTPACDVKNLAFPAVPINMQLSTAQEVAEQLGRAKLSVYVPNEIFFLRDRNLGRQPRFDRIQIKSNIKERLLELRFTRRVYLSYLRVIAFLKFSAGTPVPSNDWSWSQSLGRWRWPAIANAKLSSRSDRSQVLEAIAKNYFVKKELLPGLDLYLRAILDQLSSFSDNILILLPPHYPTFGDEANLFAPGIQNRLRAAFRQAGVENGAGFLDCSNGGNCEITADEHFADPVHLNEDGAAALSRYLAQTIAAFIKRRSQVEQCHYRAIE